MAQEVAPFLREQLLRQYGGDVTAQIESGYAVIGRQVSLLADDPFLSGNRITCPRW